MLDMYTISEQARADRSRGCACLVLQDGSERTDYCGGVGFLGSFSNHELEKLVAATMSNTRSPAKRRESAVFRTGPSGIAVVLTLWEEGSAEVLVFGRSCSGLL